jgi:protein O-GlcNAc transferase
MFPWSKRKLPAAPARASTQETTADLIARADVCRERKENPEAAALYEQALALDPKKPYAIFWLSSVYQDLGNLAAAGEWCQRGLAIDPDQIGLLLRLGSIAAAGLDPFTALQCYERVARLEPQADDIEAMLGDQYCMLGRLREGIAAFDRALLRTPDSARLQSNRLFVLNYTSFLTEEALFEEHRAWGRKHEARLAQYETWSGPVSEKKTPLRIGYVSPDFRDHPVASFLEPLFRTHDRAAFAIHCFDTSNVPEDFVTARLRAHVDVWSKVHDLSDGALAEAIRSAGIDILIDLSGHTSFNRLLTFAMKPAPVQATWLGYLRTTGLSTMDYRITDDYLDPEGTSERFHTETLCRIPNHACFAPAPEGPAEGRPPASLQGVFTFGSVNQWPKVSEEVKQTWGTLLKTVRDCRLIVVARGGQHAALRDYIVSEFVRFGARPDQVVVSSALSLRHFLELFQQIDVTLDPFPYGGGTTTMQSLWMGVPVVTLRGLDAFSRNSIGPLTEAGLSNLIADSPSQYVEIASRLVRDIDWLQDTRSGLRQRIAGSPLMDEKRFAQRMESAFRAMWSNYCEGRKEELRVV